MKNFKLTAVSISFLVSSIAICDISPDNSATNLRDRSSSELTADQQKMTGTDTEITRKIRQELVADTNLSVYAHNIKIITVNGEVTLKGPVDSAYERDLILSHARSVDGVDRVISKIDLAPKTP